MKGIFKKYWLLTKNTFSEFLEADPLNFAAIIAFYTIFSLPGILLITINIAGFFFGEEVVRGELERQIGDAVGEGTALQIQNIVENAIQSEATTLATFIGIAVLIFSATTVFVGMQDALNHIWHLRPRPERGLARLALGRILSFAMVVSLGFMMLVSLVFNVLIVSLNDYLQSLFANGLVVLIQILNIIISFALTMFIFSLIYKVLPDARIAWKNVFVGAFITTVLFVIGKSLIGLYIGNTELDNTYGAAGALVLILVWVYYSSVVLLLGAEFTYIYSRDIGKDIVPTKQAVMVEVKEVEKKAPPKPKM